MRSGDGDRPRLDLGLAHVADRFDLLLCDVWGVVHNGIRAYDRAVDALCRFRETGGSVVLVTNAPVPAGQVIARLDRLAVPRAAYDAVATSGDVTVQMIVDAGCPPIFHIGPAGEDLLYAAASRLGPQRPPLVPLEQAALVVCLGFDDSRSEPADYDEVLHRTRARSLDLICANPDRVVEMGDHLVYCAGAIAERYAALGGTVIQAGKPFTPIYDHAFRLAHGIRGEVMRARTLAIGDAIATDIRGASEQGLSSLFVTRGIHRTAIHLGNGETTWTEVLAAFLDTHAARPDLVLTELTWRL